MTELMQAVRTLAPFTGVNLLWSTDHVCTYLGVEKTKLRSFQARPDFPKAIRLPSEQGSGHPRYMSEEVVKWSLSFKEKH